MSHQAAPLSLTSSPSGVRHFVLEENMLEVDCPCVTPEVVLKASGHVDKFTDLMVKEHAREHTLIWPLYFQHFVLEENMLEVDCPCVTPVVVLKASGHVDKFTDLMGKDEKTGTCYRADHLLKDYCKDKLEKDPNLSADKAEELRHVLVVLDNLSSEELGATTKDINWSIWFETQDLYYYNGNKLHLQLHRLVKLFENS
ncbi:hypothetical protein OROMI_004290 [Orobanche minor]